MFVYLAGAIDAVDIKEARGWRDAAMERLAEEGIASFSPAHAFAGLDYRDNVIEAVNRINNAAIAHAQAMLVMWSEKSFGTIREIERARMMHAAVVMIAPRGCGFDPKKHYAAADIEVVDSLGDAVALLRRYRDSHDEMRAQAEHVHNVVRLRQDSDPPLAPKSEEDDAPIG